MEPPRSTAGNQPRRVELGPGLERPLLGVAPLRVVDPLLGWVDVDHAPDDGSSEDLPAGASGYVLKSGADDDIVDACRAAMRGHSFLYPSAVHSLVRDFIERADQRGNDFDLLTPRELEVLKLIAEGHTSKEIAAMLVISIKTVDRHRTNMLGKLGMRDRVELTRYAIRRGLIEP
jgi:DNA-binding NarL/FixJ family response regulator